MAPTHSIDGKNHFIEPPLLRMELAQGWLMGQARSSQRMMRKQVPAEQTNAENFYYLKQMQNKTPMIVVLNDGTELSGWIEWYDKSCIKLNRKNAPNLLLFKHSIKFMFKEEELHGRRRRRPPQDHRG